LAIHPPFARYAERSFDWRLSTATVNLDESRFTSLPGFTRILMILSGKILLRHEGRRERRLEEFDQDRFDGGWTTTSLGRAVDFNLMMNEGVDGNVRAITLEARREREVTVKGKKGDERRQTIAFYAYGGDVKIRLDEKEYMLDEKDILLFHDAASIDRLFHLYATASVRIIQAVIVCIHARPGGL
jgi:environmental stress-induced protein Ves